MTEISRPWNSTSPGDAGPYSFENWVNVWKMTAHGVHNNGGPFIDSVQGFPFGLHVQQTGVPSANVDILAGGGLVHGTWYANTATVTLPIAANLSGNPRIDTIILRKTWATQTIRLAVLQGTPAASPVPPTLTQSAGVTWEIPLADVAAAASFVTITNNEIRSRADFSNVSPLVVLHNVINNSGGVLEDGDVVVWDPALPNGVKTTTLGGDPKVAGVWMARTANGAVGRVVVKGQYRVNMIGVSPVNVGDRIEAGATAKIARVSLGYGNLGRVIATLGDGKPRAYIDVMHPSEDYICIRDEKATTTNGGTFTSGAYQTRDLNTEVVDTGGIASIAANQITLQSGIYRVNWSTPAYRVDGHKSRLQDVTGGGAGTTLLLGSAARSTSGIDDGTTLSIGMGRITLTAATNTLELQHRCATTRATDGYGPAAGSAAAEIYSQIEFWKEG